jgi:hypothetical protein
MRPARSSRSAGTSAQRSGESPVRPTCAFCEEQFLSILGDLGIRSAEMRSVLLSSVAVGLVMTGDIVGLEGFESADDATRLTLLTAVVDAILFTSLELPGG